MLFLKIKEIFQNKANYCQIKPDLNSLNQVLLASFKTDSILRRVKGEKYPSKFITLYNKENIKAKLNKIESTKS